MKENSSAKQPFEINPPSSSTLATICYTSGTTGNPKGALLTHKNFIMVANGASKKIVKLEETDTHFSYLPLAHIFERVMHVALYAYGAKVVFSSGDIKLVTAELVQIKPTFFIAVPRVLSKIYDGLMTKVNASGDMKKNVFHMALNQKLEGLKDNNLLNAQWDGMVFSKIKEALGLVNVRFVVTGGASIGDSLKNFWRCILAVPVVEGYGQTETAAAMTLTSLEDSSTTGHVGGPLPCVQVRLSDVPEMGYLHTDEKHMDEDVIGRGEVCCRGSGVMSGYYKLPDVTSEAIDADGWLHTGDIGEFQNDFLKITDRKKDIIITPGGDNISPVKIENDLTKLDFIEQSIVYGDNKPYLVSIIVLKTDQQSMSNEKIQTEIEKINKNLSKIEKIKKFMIIKEQFTIENGMMTPTLKLKRYKIINKYKNELEKLY